MVQSGTCSYQTSFIKGGGGGNIRSAVLWVEGRLILVLNPVLCSISFFVSGATVPRGSGHPHSRSF